MPIDKPKLKMLAESAMHAYNDLSTKGGSACHIAWTRTSYEFYEAADPAAVLVLLREIDQLKAENKRLSGLKPEAPLRTPGDNGLPRYGLRWNGPQQPIAVPMDDGYWTPWHLADRLREDRDGLLATGAHTL
ncbi:hypothetical protein G7Z99_09670 [Pseudomonas entomophila]|uniref:hypothetical protein n=1 Tax=Pseudomonas entomophila TaxID=312306 RepID=UPI0015E27D1F|nr:hypothetical protein [Pseudomonas entomophila]MBA1189318.1 hypothetical protein [Pseudomonas entomophila]